MLISCQTSSDPDTASVAVVGRVENWEAGALAEHRHDRHQLVYASKGIIYLTALNRVWLIPPGRALWIQGGTHHAFNVRRSAEVIVLYIDPLIDPLGGGSKCFVAEVGGLMKELMRSCAGLAWDYQSGSEADRLTAVLIDQVKYLKLQPLDLPMPSDPRAIKLARILKKEAANRESIAVLATRIGASKRTLERLFEKETGVSLGLWRFRQKMIYSLELLARGESVSNTSIDVGYDSPSAFVVAFKSFFGQTPSRYIGKNQ